jgi:HipA-like protein
MRKAAVYSNQMLAGYLTENDDNTFTFVYDKEYLVSVVTPV